MPHDGIYRPRNTLASNPEIRVVGHRPPSERGGHISRKRELETRPVVGDNVQGAPWDLHGDNYGRSSKKLKLKEIRSPEPSSLACSQAKPNTAREPHGTSPQPPDSRISITSSTRSFSLGRPMNGGRKSNSQTSTLHGRVMEFHNVERMMSASGMRPQRSKRHVALGLREAESRNEPSYGASDSPLVAPTVIQMDEVALVGSSTSAAPKEPYRGTANRTRLSFKERRSSLPQTDKRGNRSFRRNSSFSNHAKPSEAVDPSRERVMQTSPDVVDLDKMPQPRLSIDHTPQSAISRKGPSPAVETPASVGSQAELESLVELESPDPIQELMSVSLTPSIAPSRGQTSTHRAAVARHRANTSVSVVPRQNRIFGDSHADITRTNFTRSGRDQLVSAAADCGPSLPELHEDISWPICLVRNGPNTQTMAGLMLEFHAQSQTLSPSLGGCDLSEGEPAYASTIDDVFLVTYDYEAFRLQLGRRNRHGTRLEDKNVDFEFTSAKDIQEVVNLLSNKRISCVTKSRDTMDKIWQKRMNGLGRFISRAVEPLSNPQDDCVELSLIKRRQEVARSKRMAMEMTPSRPRVHSPSRSPPPRRLSSHHGIETDIDGGMEATRDNIGEGRLSVTSKTRIDPIRVDLPMTTRSSNRVGTRSASTRIIYRQSPSASPIVEKFSALHGLGKPWDAPVVYPFDGERKTQTSVEHRDLERLDEGEFLNDNLIAFYLKYLEHNLGQSKPETASKIYVFNTFFYERLTTADKGKRGINYEAVKRWTSNVDIFGYDYVIVPINENAHWYVAIICNLPVLASQSSADDEPIVLGSSTKAERGRPDSPSRDRATTEMDRESGRSRGSSVSLVSTARGVLHMSLSQEEVSLQAPVSNGKARTGRLSTPVTGGGDDRAEDEWPPENENGPLISPSRNEVMEGVRASIIYGKKSNRVGSIGSSNLGNSPSARRGKRRSILPPPKKYNAQDPTIITLDSLDVRHPTTVRNLKEYLRKEGKEKRELEIDIGLINGVTAKQIPQQDNLCDCGLFLLSYMEKFMQDPSGLVTKLLRRELDIIKDWTDLNPSLLRTNMRQILLALGRSQDQGRKDAKKGAAMREGRYHKGTANVPRRETTILSTEDDRPVQQIAESYTPASRTHGDDVSTTHPGMLNGEDDVQVVESPNPSDASFPELNYGPVLNGTQPPTARDSPEILSKHFIHNHPIMAAASTALPTMDASSIPTMQAASLALDDHPEPPSRHGSSPTRSTRSIGASHSSTTLSKPNKNESPSKLDLTTSPQSRRNATLGASPKKAKSSPTTNRTIRPVTTEKSNTTATSTTSSSKMAPSPRFTGLRTTRARPVIVDDIMDEIADSQSI